MVDANKAMYSQEPPSPSLMDAWREEGFLRQLHGLSETPIVHHVVHKAVEWTSEKFLQKIEELNETIASLKKQADAVQARFRCDDPDTLDECARRLLQNADDHDMSAEGLIRSAAKQEDERRRLTTKQTAWEERGCAMGLRYMAHHFVREAAVLRNRFEANKQEKET